MNENIKNTENYTIFTFLIDNKSNPTNNLGHITDENWM